MTFSDKLQERLRSNGLSEILIQKRIKGYFRISFAVTLIWAALLFMLFIKNKINMQNLTVVILLASQLLLSMRFMILFRKGRGKILDN